MTDNVLKIKTAAETRWDCASFGEVMLRFDPGFGRVRNARSFQVWEGGGEYNVARAMRKCWGKRATAVTAATRAAATSALAVTVSPAAIGTLSNTAKSSDTTESGPSGGLTTVHVTVPGPFCVRRICCGGVCDVHVPAPFF